MIQKIKQYKFLFEELVKRDFKKKYKRTVLGVGWSLLSPLLGSNIEHYVLYLFAGQLVFSFFSDATNMGMTSLIANSSIFSKVNVPKYLFLFSQNVSSLINFGLTLIIFFIFVAIEGVAFSWNFLMLIYPICCLVVFNLGIGLILSALYVFFRDMQYLWGIVSQLLMWLSAIFYSIETFAENIQRLFLLNPLYVFIKYFRVVVLDGNIPSLQFHLILLADALIAFGIGAWFYKHYNTEFLYYI